MACLLLATHLRVQSRAFAIAERHNVLNEGAAGRFAVATFSGVGAMIWPFLDVGKEPVWLTMPSSVLDIGLVGVFLFGTSILATRSARLTLALLTERPNDRIRNVHGHTIRAPLVLPFLSSALEYLPATYPDDVNVEEEALKLIAAMNPNVEL